MSKRKHCQMDSVSDLMTLEPKVSDSMKLMFLAYRAEMIYLCDVNLEYDYYWRDYADSLTHPDRPGPLGVADQRPATRDPGRNQRPATRDPERPRPGHDARVTRGRALALARPARLGHH